jgi:hypothetical protein
MSSSKRLTEEGNQKELEALVHVFEKLIELQES